MEKFKTQEIEVHGKNVLFYSWKFTKEERERLNGALSKFPDEKVNQFIDDLEKICIAAKQFFNQRNVSFQRTERKRMFGRFEKAEKELYNLIDKRRDPKEDVSLVEKKSIFDYAFLSDSMILERQRLHYLMLAAASQLKEIMNMMKDESGGPGRPSVDAATGDLVEIIAHGFKNFFEKPTGTKLASKPERQPFFSIIQIVLEACDMPCSDPSRHIKKAIKNL